MGGLSREIADFLEKTFGVNYEVTILVVTFLMLIFLTYYYFFRK